MSDRFPPIDGKTYRAGQDWLDPRGSKTGWRHAGIDIFSTPAQVVYAPEDGMVYDVAEKERTAARGHWGGYGPGGIAIAGTSGVYHWLAHLDPNNMLVKKGDAVKQGQPLGTLSADLLNPHVHWEVRRKPYCRYSKDKSALFDGLEERYPWVITVDPVRWLQGLQLTPTSGLIGVAIGSPIPTNRLRPAGYSLEFNHAEMWLAPETTDPMPSVEEKAKRPSGAVVAVVIAAAGAGLWYAHKKGLFR